MGRASDSLRGQAALVALFALIAGFWGANVTGILVSNDGSHIALARALAVRGETRIDPDSNLTIGVDLAERDGHQYSDRPPGAAFLALPAIWLGAQLDGWFFDLSRRRGAFVAAPGCPAYLVTYGEHDPDGRPLATYQGTALAAGIHAVIVGLLGLLALERLLTRFDVDLGGRLFALFAVGVGSLWGPYSTALLSHGSAIACTTGFMLAVETLRSRRDTALSLSVVAGAAGAFAIACEYSLLIVVPTAVVLLAPRRFWLGVGAGALPVAALTALYHSVAFGSPFAIGYDHHVTFDFAHSLRTTFSGNLFDGLWTLFGTGRGAGMLTRSPVLWLGLAALIMVRPGPWGKAEFPSSVASLRLWLAAFAPWVALIALHETPWGGTTQDYRYLAPLLPLLGVGLGLAWQRSLAANPALAALLLLLAMFSAHRVWTRFVHWHGAGGVPSPWVGLALGALVALYGGLFLAVAMRAASSGKRGEVQP